ncbi:MAG: hypothetical protein AAFX94_00375 [Myxococcota bacterium]
MVWILLLSVAAPADPASVQLPLQRWNSMRDELKDLNEPNSPPAEVAALDRTVRGSFQKGLFEGALEARVAVLEGEGPVQVPVLDVQASIQTVAVNGLTTSLRREGRFYSIQLPGAGIYTISVRFLWGEEQDRFARRLRFNLPPAGPTRLEIQIPETGIDLDLIGGAVVDRRESPGTTRLIGQLDANGAVNLAWRRRVAQNGDGGRVVGTVLATATVREAFVEGLAVVNLDVQEGAIGQATISLPPLTEVLSLDGPAVLQWFDDADSPGRIVVLFRYLLDGKSRFTVRYQSPLDAQDPGVTLPVPTKLNGTPMAGHLGVRGPAGFEVDIEDAVDAVPLTLRDLPPELTDLTTTPLRFGFRFDKSPTIKVRIRRLQDVELTTSVIDDLQASTVALEDGAEITKLRLRMRNNTRQYLTIALPDGAVLSHCLLDGSPVRPAVAGDGSLLIPMRQSDRRERTHLVQRGQTLSELANYYYSSPEAWPLIVQANRYVLTGPENFSPGMELVIPFRDASIQETTFVVEVAYKQRRERMGFAGVRTVELPRFDIATLKATWHLYLPRRFLPLSFSSNLSQYSAIRYDVLTRVRQFLELVFRVDHAWAGGDERYQSILEKRKSIYREESRRRQRSEGVTTSFPLVGSRYRFKRVLLGEQQAQIQVTFVDAAASPYVRWSVFALVFLLAIRAASAPMNKRDLGLCLGAVLLSVLAGYFFLGVNRKIIWALDAALIVVLARQYSATLWRRLLDWLANPLAWLATIRLRNVALLAGLCFVAFVVVQLPLLASTVGLLLLATLWWRSRREVTHG